jgi:hypothetical protein
VLEEGIVQDAVVYIHTTLSRYPSAIFLLEAHFVLIVRSCITNVADTSLYNKVGQLKWWFLDTSLLEGNKHE